MNYFSPSETKCRCGCGFNVKPEFLSLLNRIREEYGKPITVTSAARCEAHNMKIGGAGRSAHLEGIAADLVRTPGLLAFIEANLERFDICMEDPTVTTNWIHIDMRKRKNRIFKP